MQDNRDIYAFADKTQFFKSHFSEKLKFTEALLILEKTRGAGAIPDNMCTM